jgi:hypothetical protein
MMQERFRSAIKACEEAIDGTTVLEHKLQLIRAAFLFAQVAEHIERGNFLNGEILERCRSANSSIRDDRIRAKIEALLFDTKTPSCTGEQPGRRSA